MDESTDGSRGLGALIGAIAARRGGGGTWRLAADELPDLLGVAPAEFYRRIYASDADPRSPVSLSMATDDLGPESAGALVSLAELFSCSDAEAVLSEAGIFLPHARQVEALRVFLDCAAEAVARHRHDPEAFSAMLRRLRSYDAASRAYLEAFLPTDAILDRAVDAYCRDAGFTLPEVGRITTRLVLELHLRRHILREEAFLAPVIAALYAQALAEGYVRSTEDAGEQPAEGGELSRARQVFGLHGRRLSRPVVRERYRQLLKRYHPDVNPQGLERCKEINAAYSVLVESITAG